MADNIKIAKSEPKDGPSPSQPLDVGREYSEKLQSLGKTLIASLYMLVRSVKLYDPDNAIFSKPLTQLQDTINTIIAKEGKLELQGMRDSFYLNNMLIKVDVNSLDNVRYLQTEMQAKDVGGFTLVRPVTPQELKNFISIFSKDQAQSTEEDGLAGKKLVQMKVTKFSSLKEKLDKDNLDQPDDQKVDRKKYAMTCYARAVFFLKKHLDLMKQGKPLPAAKAGRVVQDLVDVCYEQRTHFLGMTSLREEADYHVYHQVNTALMAIVFGNELQLTKAQMRDVGLIAMFHETGMSAIPDEVLKKRGALSASERSQVGRMPIETVKQILAEKSFSKTSLMRVVATFEHKQEFGSAVKDARGSIQMIIPKGQLSAYAKMIAICCTYDALTSKRPFRDAYGPEIALTLMWAEMRHKFDPEFLKVFMKVMAIQPIRVLSKNRQTVSIG
jgi:HD-GYP domain-containing protein (c-di-GMP phosphodiesterase class II)